jgi:uncharacterized protein YciI
MQRIVVALELVNGLPDQEVGAAQQAFLAQLYEEGTLMFAGPFIDERGGGIAILRCDSLEKARAIYQESPVVRSGHAITDVREWNVMWGVDPAVSDLQRPPSP